MQSLIRSKSAGVTGGRGTAGAGPGRVVLLIFHCYMSPFAHIFLEHERDRFEITLVISSNT